MLQLVIAATLSFLISLLLYPHFIQFLKNNELIQKPSEYALEEFESKDQTPTFGGFIFLVVPLLVSLLFFAFKPDVKSKLVMMSFFAYGLIGLIDDYKIVKEGRNDGLSAKTKFVLQLIVAFVFYFIYMREGGSHELFIPFKKTPINLSYFFFVFVLLVMTGSSNAVNLTDGMDGLAGGTSVITLIPLAFLAYKADEKGLLLFILALIGSLMAFLVYNRHPARIFMGDVGSLALGGAMAAIAIVLEKEIIFAILAFVFVFETLTVIIQQLSIRLFKKRVFPYTPIHYSFTLGGWKEKDVVMLFYALALTFAIIGMGLNALS